MTDFEITVKLYLKAVDKNNVREWLEEKLKHLHFEVDKIEEFDGTIRVDARNTIKETLPNKY